MPVQLERHRPATLDLDKLRFDVFSSEEIRKFSVCKVLNTVSFDSLGNSVTAGLYDVSMGPSQRREICTTCFNDQNDCIGHFGHIELVMPCFNPLFMKMTSQILRASCLKCHKLQISERKKEIIDMQLRLVDAGYVIEAQELEEQKILHANTVKVTFTGDDAQDEVKKVSRLECIEKSYNKMMKAYRKLLERDPVNHYGNTKNSQGLRNSIVSAALADCTSGTSKFCIHCKLPRRRVRYSYKKLVVTVFRDEIIDSGRGSETLKQTMETKTIIAAECKEIMHEIFLKDCNFLRILFPVLNELEGKSHEIFFMDVIPVVPPNCRPPNRLRDGITEHPQTRAYHAVLQANNQLRYIIALKKLDDGSENILLSQAMKSEAETIYQSARGETAQEKIYFKWEELQLAVDLTLDVTSGSRQVQSESSGLKQLIEKKQGMIRMNMMGKRVNFACRTVITPDPNIGIDEIGIPEAFALKLTYPVHVTPWNVSFLRKLVMNGPNVHPGAIYIENGQGQKIAIPKDAAKREAIADVLLKPEKNGRNKIVHRHLLNGDALLLNRQPTLHKPSIMAHKARILKNEKTFRLHYSNCKSYNADFDGDEMNAHFPQNEVGRSEAYNLANVASNYLVPKDGTPLGGLIQDHVISGVKMSMRGRFFSKSDYQELVFQGLSRYSGDIQLLPPAIIKPVKLWSGKQILSTIIINLIPKGKPAINLKSTAKIGANRWINSPVRYFNAGGAIGENELAESEVIIRGGELLVGILDKNHYGSTPYSLIHCMYELYGGDVSTNLLTSLAMVFTMFLQWEGFTLGVRDILVTKDADKKRRKIVEESRKSGKRATCEALDISIDSTDEEMVEKLKEAYSNDPKFRTKIDRKYKSILTPFTDDINETCLPAGLISKFPENNLQLMVTSGAKGSTVNTMQISCLLGQIELEGKRPPLMISGKSLPSFPIFECSPKAGGFIDGRFMTGIQPQDFFFHCMAGREGLIDTAVKTSRSGYLQRCLVKHLESLNVAYDGTVRDSDNTVVQFMYGEDGLDILKAQFIKQKMMPFLYENRNVIVNQEVLKQMRNSPEEDEEISKMKKKIRSYKKKLGSTLQKPLRSERRLTKSCPATITSKYPPHRFFGAISEAAEEILEKYLKSTDDVDDDEMRDMLFLKNSVSLADPGEPVGLIAAQSIGEPSTQMTLNTFHFAGRGDMNVTLGIPRLREILMMASANIKTPSMEIPFLNQNSEKLAKTAEKFRVRLNKVTLADVIEKVDVKTFIVKRPARARFYEFKFHFLPFDAFKNQFKVKPKMIFQHFYRSFVLRLMRAIEKASKEAGGAVVQDDKETKKTRKSNDDDDEVEDDPGMPADKNAKNADEDDSSDDELADDADATDERKKQKQADNNDYEEPDSDEEKRDAGKDSDDSDDEFDVSKVKLEVDDAFDVSMMQQKVLPNNDDAEQLDEIERKEEELIMLKAGDKDILDLLARFSSATQMTVREFDYDKEKYAWVTIQFEAPIKFKNLDVTNIIRELARASTIHEVPRIKRAFVDRQKNGLVVTTEGINIGAMFEYDKILDLNKLYTNDIHAVARTYGIEAAARVVIKEVQNVFNVYGIHVDPRHLSLISDYMTFDGTFKPLNRKGIETSASPLQQISFESAMVFLKNAVVSGRTDDIRTPSSCLMVGQHCKCGTGSFGLVNDLSKMLSHK